MDFFTLFRNVLSIASMVAGNKVGTKRFTLKDKHSSYNCTVSLAIYATDNVPETDVPIENVKRVNVLMEVVETFYQATKLGHAKQVYSTVVVPDDVKTPETNEGIDALVTIEVTKV